MLHGVIPALLTPFTSDGAQVDGEALGRLCDFLVSAQVEGVFVTGTTGEFIGLNPDERRFVIREAVRRIAGRVKVIVHIGSFNTAEASALAGHAKDLGVTGIASLPPYFHPLDDEALYRYFSTICEKADGLPVYLYNLPAFARNEVSLPLMKRLKAAYPHLRGTKDSSGDMKRLKAEVEMRLPGFDVVCGSDEQTITGLKFGASASVSSTANAFPEVFQAVYAAFDAGNLDEAEKAQERLSALTEVLLHGKFLAAYKSALKLRGFDVGAVRPPQRELTDAESASLASGLKKLALLP